MPFVGRLRSAALVGACVIGILAGAVSDAAAQELSAARRLYLDADFEAAAHAFEDVLASSALTRNAAIEAHIYLAALGSILRNPTSGREHVRAAVALDPAVQAPEGAPADVEGWIAETRDAFADRPATLEIWSTEALRAGSGANLRARLSPAPRLLASTIRLVCTAGDSRPEEAEGPPPELDLRLWLGTETDRLRCDASLLTSARAPLLVRHADLTVVVESRRADREPAREDRGTARLWPWIAAGGGLILAGIVVWFFTSTPDTATISRARVDGFPE